MATTEQKQKLIDTLKFTPRTYTVSMWGYGGEKVMGTVSPQAWNYCVKNNINIEDLAWDSELEEDLNLDVDQLPFPPGAWYECDDMGHISGVSRDAGTLQVLDENNETVFEKTLEACNGCDDSPELCCNDEVWIGSRKQGEIVFVGSSNEKGTFFEGEINLTAPFDITKLQLHYDEFDGEDIVTGLYYNDEEIENNGYGTDGKSSDFTMLRLIDDAGNFERYAGQDSELIHETGTNDPIDFPESKEWDPAVELDKIVLELPEPTEWFPASVDPVHKGLYEVTINATATWPFPNMAHYMWTGKAWQDVDGKKATIYQWRGLTEKVE